MSMCSIVRIKINIFVMTAIQFYEYIAYLLYVVQKIQDSIKQNKFQPYSEKTNINILILLLYMYEFLHSRVHTIQTCLQPNLPSLITLILLIFFFQYSLPAFFFLGNRNLTLFWNGFGYQSNKDMEMSLESIQHQRKQAMAIPFIIQCGEC